jgi:hypothetical protein
MGRRGHIWEGHFRVAPETGRGRAVWRAWQAIQGGSGRWPLRNMAKLQHLQGRPAGTTANRSGRVCASCKPKVHHNRRCVDTYPGQCCVGGPWDAGGDSGVEDIRYGTDTHQRGMPCEVRWKYQLCQGAWQGHKQRRGVRRVQCSPVQCCSS